MVANFAAEDPAAELHVSWCTYSPPMLDIYGESAPFKYTEYFGSLEEVTRWAVENPRAISENSERVDRILLNNSLPRSANNLVAQTLHSWLANTWWTKKGQTDWFTVWEGSCYYHSTVDVEYTQTPFYLTLWPELLGLELDMWPHFTVSGEEVLGERGKDSVIFMHDIGWVTDCDTMRYHHHMPVEENTNYILMSYAYWKRTGDKSLIVKHKDTIVKALRFLELSDTTGNGVPDEGMSNTIDDASPALQFGKEQVYLAVKTLAAFWASCEMLEGLVESDQLAEYFLRARKILQRLHEQGWKDDHFVTVLDPAYEGVYDAWSQEFIPGPLPGWDAAHIYTTNGLVLLDMVGASLGLDHRKICQDLQVALERCLVKYGCCHSDYFSAQEDAAGEGGNIMGNKRGWISMNVARHIAAFYRGLDFS